ncbi:ubiquinone/menaquinone biosynthesis C-methylase UbiE [Kibdelosporangium banguiense]|uniref:Ubiquinone/menaquinone biosynthesis C-methylase UbiE n=1 Tax=Kibdelosporangium banguiense TaxID=1365924 RepID=A0ABS4TC23_9PSEU|nr:class I SAM-dependent methyltransferase [Kibdelosporangium banguiense]MBP2321982.1 ubiquinone/menaquinone biosynthesis C-methylase UbiE [Kibdelosporangium banguiense]
MMEPAYLTSTRASYDTVASSYASLVRPMYDNKPFDRAMLAAFAELVDGPVADLGCGTGIVTGYLAGLGVRVSGVDLSPGMVAVARRDHPELEFSVGSMNSLDLADSSVGGVVAWYSIIHTPVELLPEIFAEFRRVLVPGGHLMVAFKAGDEIRHLAQGYGHDIELDVYWLEPDLVAKLAHDAGFTEVARLVRIADADEKGPQGYFLARVPDVDES